MYMHIFQRLVPDESALGDFAFNLAQPTCDHLKLVSCENSSSGQGVGDGPGNIVSIKPPSERDRFAVALRYLARRR